MDQSKKYWESTNPTIPEELRVVLNEYLLSLKLANKAEATIKKYRWILERFFSDCKVPLEKLTSDEVFKWLKNYTKDKKEKTSDLFLSAFSSFFSFCRAEDYMDAIVIKKRWRPKIPKTLPKFLTQEEYARVRMYGESLPLRDRALILFLFTSGCRRSELMNLTIQDIDLEHRSATVKGKGKKIRYVHFSEECGLVLKEYLETRSIDKKEPLFLTRFGKGLKACPLQKVYLSRKAVV